MESKLTFVKSLILFKQPNYCHLHRRIIIVVTLTICGLNSVGKIKRCSLFKQPFQMANCVSIQKILNHFLLLVDGSSQIYIHKNWSFSRPNFGNQKIFTIFISRNIVTIERIVNHWTSIYYKNTLFTFILELGGSWKFDIIY